MARYAKRDHGSGQVFKDESRKRWRGQVTIAGRRRSVSARTEGEARAKLQALVDGDESELGEADLTVGKWLALWVEDIAETKTENTRDNRRGVIKRWRPIFAISMADLLTPDVEHVLKTDAAAGYSRNTLVRMKSVLGMAFDSWNGRTKRVFNPARLAHVPETVETKERQPLDVEQAAKLLEVAAETPNTGLLVTLGLWFGLRPGEVAGLTWANVDTESGVIAVRRMRRRENGKDGKQVLTLTNAPKARSFRSLAIPADVLAQLRRHKTAQTTMRLASTEWHELDLVISTRTGTPLDPSNHRREVANLAKAAGIFRPLTPNELRHTAATLLIDQGYSITEVADFLGHKNERMLIETYRHKMGRTLDMRDGMAAALGAAV